jgi:probable phosphoglycerate mutase
MAEFLLFCRHGESEFNVRGIVNGDPTVVCSLSSHGRRQSRALGDRLAADPVELCVTSEFQRAKETAANALESRGVPHLVAPELNDPRLGRLEREPLATYLAWLRANEPFVCPPEGGESQYQAIARYCRAYDGLVRRPERCIVVVCHALPVGVAVALAQPNRPVVRPEYPPVPAATPYRIRSDDLRDGVRRALEELAKTSATG